MKTYNLNLNADKEIVTIDGINYKVRWNGDGNFDLWAFRVFDGSKDIGTLWKDEEGKIYFESINIEENEPQTKEYQTLEVKENISNEDYAVLHGNSKEIEDDFWTSSKEYSVNIPETKELLNEMNSYHPFPKNYFRSVEPREMERIGNGKDIRFEQLQKQLMKTLNHCTQEEREVLAKHIRNLSYSK